MDANQQEEMKPDLKSLLERNIALSEEILKHAKKTHHHLMWGSVFSTVKWVIMLAPIVLAWWYFPTFTKQITGFTTDIGKQFDFFQKQMQQISDLQKQAEQVQRQVPKRK